MNAIDFPQANRSLGPPPSMTAEECGGLRIHGDGQQCISCWLPTAEELERLNAGEPVYLFVLSGITQPPVKLEVGSPFQRQAPSESDAAALKELGISAETL